MVKEFFYEHKELFETYAKKVPSSLCYYTFNVFYSNWCIPNVTVLWEIIDEHLCIFVKYDGEIWMPLPPMGDDLNRLPIEKCFQKMHMLYKKREKSFENGPFIFCVDQLYKEKIVSLDNYYTIEFLGNEYLYDIEQIKSLKGGKFKKKRNAIKRLKKDFDIRFITFQDSSRFEIQECINLSQRWMSNKLKNLDEESSEYQSIEWSYEVDKLILEQNKLLDIDGGILFNNTEILGYIAGCNLANGNKCILIEKTLNSKIQGIQPLLRQLYAEQQEDTDIEISTMDDSGFDTLRLEKLKYAPSKLIPTYIITEA